MDKENGQVYSQFKRLQNPKDAREFMQKLINAFDKNRVTEDKARTLGYLIKIFLSTWELSDLNERVEELENIANKKVV